MQDTLLTTNSLPLLSVTGTEVAKTNTSILEVLGKILNNNPFYHGYNIWYRDISSLN